MKTDRTPEQKTNQVQDLTGYNLIMVSLDTLRQDRLGAYGNPLPVSPFLDELCRRSFVFSNVLAQTPSTSSSHRSVFTSRYLHTQDRIRPPDSETIAGIFTKRGWRTGGFVDGGQMSRQFGLDAGFTVYNDQPGGFEMNLPRAVEWLTDSPEDPFFLLLHTYDIHCPYLPPREHFEAAGGDWNPDLMTTLDGTRTCYLNDFDLHEGESGVIPRLYDGGIRYADHQLGRFWKKLHESPAGIRSVLIVFSDHGESLGERQYYGHNQVYEVQLRVPLMIYVPGTRGKLIESPIENVDILPTILDLFHVSQIPSIQGRSLFRDMFDAQGAPGERLRISEGDAKSIRSESGWKLIVRDSFEKDEVYHLIDDPDELDNRVLDPGAPREKLFQDLVKSTGLSEETVRTYKSPGRARMVIMNENMAADDQDLFDQLKELGYVQ